MIARIAQHRRSRAFSLIELVIVIVILGVIGAIAIPRMSRGASGAAESGALSDLSILRSAIELYAAEHEGAFPALATFDTQLTLFTDASGGTNATKTAVFMYGPYLRSIPAQKGGPRRATRPSPVRRAPPALAGGTPRPAATCGSTLRRSTKTLTARLG
jgi:prepilin-type N-terminal cleavage/methylation domain-containing protein